MLESLDAAAAVLDELAARGLRLRLDVTEGSRSVRVRVTEPGAALIRELDAIAALDLLAGGSADGFLAGIVA